MKFKICITTLVIASFVLLGACSKNTPDSPEEISVEYLTYIKENNLKEANELVGIEFNEKNYESMESYKKKAMDLVYQNMSFDVKKEKVDGKTAKVTVEIESVNYLSLLDQATFESLSKHGNQDKTFEIFEKSIKNAERNKKKVEINFIKESGKWKFDGSNSLLQAAMLGYLE
ncbi:hypothetical protein ACWG0P_01340 [Amedibacillus sp. YH-ame6]